MREQTQPRTQAQILPGQQQQAHRSERYNRKKPGVAEDPGPCCGV